MTADLLSDLDAATENARPWLAHCEKGFLGDMDFRSVSLTTWLDEAAETAPQNNACLFDDRKISYARLQKDAETMAARLRAYGVKPGDTVGIMLPNLPQTVQAFWGVLKAGAVVCMINPLYMEKELTHQLHDANVKHLITVDSCWPKLEALHEKLGVEHYFVTTPAEGLSFLKGIVQGFKARREKGAVKVPYGKPHVHRFTDLLRGGERYSHAHGDPKETIALLQYTGGTTGLSKGAMLSHWNLGCNIQQVQAHLKDLSDRPQTMLAVLPLFHVYGLCTCLALPVIMKSAVAPVLRFVPHELADIIHKYKATVMPGAPSLYLALLQQKSLDKKKLESLKLCICGSAPMPVEALKRFQTELNATVIEGYGLSEASPITHLSPVAGQNKIGAIGIPLPGTDARIVDMELGSLPLPPGAVGELIIKGPQVMSGYRNKPDETAGALRNGWLYTGDIAYMDEDGYFFIVDRKKDMVIVAGYNVSPREIDEVLYTHPKVAEAVTVGVPHSSRGETIKAYIVLKAGETMEKQEVTAWCRARLAPYKVPRLVEFRDALPKTQVGKILRRTLRAEEEEVQKNNPGFVPEDDFTPEAEPEQKDGAPSAAEG